MSETCAAVIWHSFRYDTPEPDEYCDNDATHGDYCAMHQEDE